ncbi:Bacterial membrane protein YfhO [compost metagenome]
MLSFGRYTPLYHVWAALPVLKTMPGAGRHALEVDVALAVLAGYGLQALFTAGAAERRRWAAWGLAVAAGPVIVTVVGVALVGPTLAARMAPYMPAHLDVSRALTVANPGVWWPLVVAIGTAVALGALAMRPGPAARGLLLAVLTLDLAVFGHHVSWRQTSPRPGDLLITEAPARPVSEDRLLSVAALRFPYDDVPHVSHLHYALFGALRGERAIGGYDSFYYARYGQLLGIKDVAGMLTDPRVWEPRHHVFDVLTLRTLRLDAALADTPTWRARLTPDRWRPVGREPGVAIYENQRRLPRAWRPDAAIALAPDAVDAHMRGEAPWDPRRQALLDAPTVAPPATPGTAHAATLSMNRIRVETEGAGPGLVLVSEGYDPGWKAFIGDRELRVHRADALVLGIEVPAGRHTIALRYEPPRWRLGLVLTGLSLVLAVLWALWGVRRSRPTHAFPATPAPETAAPPPS